MSKKIEIIKIVASSIGVKTSQLTIKSSSSDFAKWDSLANVKIIIGLEKKFKKKIQSNNFTKLNSIKNIISIYK